MRTLLGFLGTALALAAARVAPTTALIITPAAHDFGQVIVGAQGTVFQFKVTVPPGAGPTDSIHTQYGGTNPLEFRDYAGVRVVPRPAPNACADSIPRSGICYLWVEFVPQARGPRSATMQVWDTRGNSGTATLTGTGVFGCTMYESLRNYGAFYSGTFSWNSSLTIGQGAASGPHTRGTRSNEVTVAVTNGRAACQGTSAEDESDFEGARLDHSRRATGVISGPGLFAVEFKKEGGRPVYQITVACPSAQVTETITDYISNETQTGTNKSKPANWRDRTSVDQKRTSADSMNVLSRRKTFPHPDEDPLNGVTGTMTFTWSLRSN